MDFSYSPKTIELQARMEVFYAEHILPNEKRFHDDIEANTKAGKRWTPVQLLDELKPKAKAAGLWNLFMPGKHGAGLTNLEYAPLAAYIGHPKFLIAQRPIPETWKCSPNTARRNNSSNG
jgi:acyl-CoA dehydrogenase